MSEAAHIAKALGGRKMGDHWLCRCPVSSHGKGKGDRSPSLSIRDGEVAGRVLVKCFAGCDPQDILAEFRDHGLLPDALGVTGGGGFGARPVPSPRAVPASPSADDDTEQRRQKALALWAASVPAGGTTAEVYLRSRGIELAHIPGTIRYLRPSKPSHHPAMISAFALPHAVEPGRLALSRDDIRGVHLTFLRPDGAGKAQIDRPKIMIGRSSGTPIVVAPIGDGLGLAITEGIEDAFSAHIATGLGAWAAGSASRMPALADAIPSYVEAVTIVGDDDEAGRRGSGELQQRLAGRGIDAITAFLDLRRDTA